MIFTESDYESAVLQLSGNSWVITTYTALM